MNRTKTETTKTKTRTKTKAKESANATPKVVVGLGTCGVAAGGGKVFEAFKEQLKKVGIKAELTQTGCIGLCFREVLVDIVTPEDGKLSYGNVTPDMVSSIIKEHLVESKPIREWIVLSDRRKTRDGNLLVRQNRIALRNCGVINPENIDEYIARDGYKALEKVLGEMSPEQVIGSIKQSGLRGRGGAGFPTGLKWEFTSKAKGEPKYVVCNADEGDPGAFMDRSILEGDPHAVLEGMLVAGYAIGASQGYIYVRAEYPLAIKRLAIALAQAKANNFIGKNILRSRFSFDIKIKQGAGAFVCGEETALIASIEGRRGMPRIRPPFPASCGLWGKPTNINNVETFANVSWIILNGASRYRKIGTRKSKGTKVFALTGEINRTGLVEVSMGTTLREVIFDIGGGIKNGGKFKAVQIGGPSGGCLPSSFLDLPVDYEAITKTGAIMGSGGMVVVSHDACMVDLARFFLNFTQHESCGKCVPCRLGTKRMLEILNRITEGKGESSDLKVLETLARDIKTASLCGLGQTAPNPILTTLKYFKEEYRVHIEEKRCPARVCVGLAVFIIKDRACTGCGVCVKHCPVGAISGRKKEAYHIDEAKCIKCGLCVEHCPFDAIYRL